MRLGGRRRLPGPREPNGRLVRTPQIKSVEQILENAALVAKIDGATECAVYVICPVKDLRPCKIGVSIDPVYRLTQLQTSHWLKLRIYNEFWLSSQTEAFAVEAAMHRFLRDTALLGEWFGVDGPSAVEAISQTMTKIKVHTLDNKGVKNVR